MCYFLPVLCAASLSQSLPGDACILFHHFNLGCRGRLLTGVLSSRLQPIAAAHGRFLCLFYRCSSAAFSLLELSNIALCSFAARVESGGMVVSQRRVLDFDSCVKYSYIFMLLELFHVPTCTTFALAVPSSAVICCMRLCCSSCIFVYGTAFSLLGLFLVPSCLLVFD